MCPPGFVYLTSNFWYFTGKDHHVQITGNESATGQMYWLMWLVFCWTCSPPPPPPPPKKKQHNKRVHVACVVCVCVCVLDGEGSWVFASRALVVVLMASDYLTGLHEPLLNTLQVSHQLVKMSVAITVPRSVENG